VRSGGINLVFFNKSGEAIISLIINLNGKIFPFIFLTLWMCCENELRVENHFLAICANNLFIYLNLYTITIKRRINKALHNNL
jgi:hypothetical protein